MRHDPLVPTAGNARITLLICAAIAAVGAAALVLIFSTEPTPQRETAVRQTAMLVDVTTPEAGTFRPVIEALGTVVPARDITLRPRVSGQVVEISEQFTPGGFVREGETLLRIEQADYTNALQQRQAELAQARADLEMEQGQAAKAKQDYESLGRELPPERRALVLRLPQLHAAEAALQSAQAAVEQAELDLARTTIDAPFDAHVLTRQVNVGSQVSVGDALARLVGVDTYWVEATIPVDKLRWLDFADGDQGETSSVQVRNRTAWPADVYREGYLYRLVGELEANTRLARVLVAVPDPLVRASNDPDTPRLIIGAFVESRIQGRPIENVVRLDRDYLRKDDTVWLMRDGKLAVEPVDVVFKDNRYAYVRGGLDAGDRVVTSSLATVKEGSSLRTSAAPGSDDVSKERNNSTNADASTVGSRQP